MNNIRRQILCVSPRRKAVSRQLTSTRQHVNSNVTQYPFSPLSRCFIFSVFNIKINFTFFFFSCQMSYFTRFAITQMSQISICFGNLSTTKHSHLLQMRHNSYFNLLIVVLFWIERLAVLFFKFNLHHQNFVYLFFYWDIISVLNRWPFLRDQIKYLNIKWVRMLVSFSSSRIFTPSCLWSFA